MINLENLKNEIKKCLDKSFDIIKNGINYSYELTISYYKKYNLPFNSNYYIIFQELINKNYFQLFYFFFKN